MKQLITKVPDKRILDELTREVSDYNRLIEREALRRILEKMVRMESK